MLLSNLLMYYIQDIRILNKNGIIGQKNLQTSNKFSLRNFDQFWDKLLKTDKGYNLLVQIPNFIDSDYFDHFITDIDTTIQAIDRYE